MAHPFVFLDYVFPLILGFIAVFRIWTILTSKIVEPERALPAEKSNPRPEEMKEPPSPNAEYQTSRSNTMTLAFFTITVITITITLVEPDHRFEFGLAYLSLAMFCFFIGSYMFIFLRRLKGQKHFRLPHIGETLEFVGIVALGTGLFYIVTLVVEDSIGLVMLYLLFLFALIAVAFYELYQNKKYYHDVIG